MPTPEPNLETQVIHGGRSTRPPAGATVTPIFQTSSFAYDTAEALEAVFAGRQAGFVYSRINNPSLHAFEQRITALEGGLASLSCASGMAAISTAVLTLAGTGDEIVSANSIFGGTYSLFKHTLSQYGITTRFVESTDAAAYRAAITERTKLLFVESVGNPKLDVPDLAAIAKVADEAGVVLAVDNTVTTPLLLRPKLLGAGLVIHSTSKFINGHGNAIGGMIVDCGTFQWSNPRYANLQPYYKRAGHFAFMAALRNLVYRDLGGCSSPFNAFLMSIGMETLAVRMERHCSNAAAVAAFLSADSRVEAVRYPGLPDHPDHEVARRQFGGRFGALVTLRLGSRERAFRFINALKYARNLANLGDTKTLVIHPASTICRDGDAAERAAMGVSDDLVRFSIGLEHCDDLLADLDQSLEQA